MSSSSCLRCCDHCRSYVPISEPLHYVVSQPNNNTKRWLGTSTAHKSCGVFLRWTETSIKLLINWMFGKSNDWPWLSHINYWLINLYIFLYLSFWRNVCICICMFFCMYVCTYLYMVCVYGCMCISYQCNNVNSHLAILSDKCCTQFFPHFNRLRARVAVVGLATVICLRKKKMKVDMKKRFDFCI